MPPSPITATLSMTRGYVTVAGPTEWTTGVQGVPMIFGRGGRDRVFS